MKNGIELYSSQSGAGKGKHRARLRANGNIIATNGEGHMNQSQCTTWPLRVFKALWKLEECRQWASHQMMAESWPGRVCKAIGKRMAKE